jgi:hypothetical protein
VIIQTRYYAPLLIACCAFCSPHSGGTAIEAGQLLSQPLTLKLEPTTLLDALFQVGRATNACIGVIVPNRTMALASTRPLDASRTKLSDALSTLLAGQKQISFAEAHGCVIVQPTTDRLAYLNIVIPRFQIPRAPLEIVMTDLGTFLRVTDTRPAKGPRGLSPASA